MGNVELIPYSGEHLVALIEGEESFEASFGRPAAEGYQAFFASGLEEASEDWLSQLLESTDPDPWVHGFAIVRRESGGVIGNVGFKGPPDQDGMVEIAYGIAPAFQGKGYATEATEAGVAFAFADTGVRLVRAHTLPTPNASTRVLAKCGFERIGEIEDPEDGLVWRWERPRDSA